MLKLISQQICPQRLGVAGDICAKTLHEDTDPGTADLPRVFRVFSKGECRILDNRN